MGWRGEMVRAEVRGLDTAVFLEEEGAAASHPFLGEQCWRRSSRPGYSDMQGNRRTEGTCD